MKKYTFPFAFILAVEVLLSWVINPGMTYHFLVEIAFKFNIVLLGIGLVLYSKELEKKQLRLMYLPNRGLLPVGLIFLVVGMFCFVSVIANRDTYYSDGLGDEVPLVLVTSLQYFIYTTRTRPIKEAVKKAVEAIS